MAEHSEKRAGAGTGAETGAGAGEPAAKAGTGLGDAAPGKSTPLRAPLPPAAPANAAPANAGPGDGGAGDAGLPGPGLPASGLAEPGPEEAAPRGLGSRFHKLWTASTVSNLGQGASAIAFPWLATTLTQNPVLIALNGVAVRLPWLLFSLPAGALADRLDRRRVLLAMSAARAVIVGVVALLVAWDAMSLPLLYCCALVLGFAEVMFDNTSQVLLPSVVDRRRLAAANGRLMSAQIVADSFLARPLGGALIALAVAAPFAFDASAAAVSLVLLLTLRGSFRARPDAPTQPAPPAATDEPGAKDEPRTADEPGAAAGSVPAAGAARSMRAEIREGVRWLWRHPLVRPLAVSLAVMNLVGAATESIYVLYAQEVLGLGPVGFAVLTSVTGIGGLLGGLLAARIGTSRSLFLLLALEVAANATTALASNAFVIGLGSVAMGFGIVVWNVTTVSLRQSLVPDRLLGRVNSVYRLLGWGSMPLGMAAGGALVSAVEALWGREAGLRAPFVLAVVLVLGLARYMRRHLGERAIKAALSAS
ncbi:MFS transporter [Streptomyces hoynatensis]|uniref:MFS transporter n=1 Tax=Streptomyces hoynatensis TaxID=1141874 RepID=A0A3A9YLJ1_9ACTN|nr:MFS transporter [Streptomyces hoynatensis]RKN37378.1 MFS transporter [Streptomyces hoynatensis]